MSQASKCDACDEGIEEEPGAVYLLREHGREDADEFVTCEDCTDSIINEFGL